LPTNPSDPNWLHGVASFCATDVICGLVTRVTLTRVSRGEVGRVYYIGVDLPLISFCTVVRDCCWVRFKWHILCIIKVYSFYLRHFVTLFLFNKKKYCLPITLLRLDICTTSVAETASLNNESMDIYIYIYIYVCVCSSTLLNFFVSISFL
jgi:hypothetical protein